jgi:NADH-quinone oxidoreductase subunit N
MIPNPVTQADLHLAIPELFMCGAGFGLLLVDMFLSEQRRALTHFLALLILAAVAVLTVRELAGAPVQAFSGFFVRDLAADVLKLSMYVVTGLVFVYAKPFLIDRGLFKGEFYALVLFALLGMMLMVSAGGLVTLYLGLELLALSAYGLVAMDRDNPIASEAAMKYFVLGSMASGMLLYGMSMVYGATGSLQLDEIYAAAGSGQGGVLLSLGVVFG